MRINFMANANILIFPIVLGSILFCMKIKQKFCYNNLKLFSLRQFKAPPTEHGIIRKIELYTFSSLKQKKKCILRNYVVWYIEISVIKSSRLVFFFSFVLNVKQFLKSLRYLTLILCNNEILTGLFCLLKLINNQTLSNLIVCAASQIFLIVS